MTKKQKTVITDWGVDEFSSLHQAGTFLPKDVKERLGLLMPVDVYVQDPYVAKENRGIDFSQISVCSEPDLMDGPTSARIAVVDYDGDTGKLEKPARWDAKIRRFVFEYKGKQEPITKNGCTEFQFHQVNVWAIIQSVLDIYQEPWVLGRSAPWAFKGNRLIVVPHAGYMANAFYDRSSKSIQFYYFGSEDKRVYTCLSHDIIAHETGHAILDGLRPGFIEDSSLQTTAFHEFVADLTAIVTSLLNNELRWTVADEFLNSLSSNPIEASLKIVSSLAEEFGRYAMDRPYLRSAESLNTVKELKKKGNTNPYDWSEVLTGAMFDIFKEIVAKYMLKKLKSKKKPTLKQALSFAVNRFRRIALQPLDYLPPVDVQFSDYACAVLQADQMVYPVDEDGFRDIIRKCFIKRGIACPRKGEEQDRPNFYAYDIGRLALSRTDAYYFLNENRRQLCIPAEQDIEVVDLYQTNKTVIGAGKLPREVVLQYAWREDVELTGSGFGPLNKTTASLLCGGTLVFDGRGNVLYWSRKPGAAKQTINRGRRRSYCINEQEKGEQRQQELVRYIKDRVGQGYIGLIDSDRPQEIDMRPPVAAHRVADGAVRLEVTPHLRHWKNE
ncbi:MAG: hypothetical protein PVG39_25890 [Desulfobacteraceae bacterium]|jgi:hypothetical protein